MKSILVGILLILSTLASAGTSSGRRVEVIKSIMISDVKIDSLSSNSVNLNNPSKLYIKGQLVLNTDSFLSISAVFMNDRILVINENGGGNSCVGTFRVIRLYDTGYTMTKQFGNCSPPDFYTKEGYIILMFPENDTERFVKYKVDTAGTLTQM